MAKDIIKAKKSELKKVKKDKQEVAIKKRTYYIECRDSSGSMASIKNQIIDASNKQFETLKAESDSPDMETTVTVVNFATKVHKPTLLNEHVDKLNPLNEDSYKPSGWTALYNAIGSTIDLVKKFPHIDDENTFVYFVIITDGEDNRSVEYNSAVVAAKIKSLEETKRWRFVYIGANQDLKNISATLGIKKEHMLNYASTRGGTSKGMTVVNNALTDFMRARTTYSTAAEASASAKLTSYVPINKDGIADATIESSPFKQITDKSVK